MTCRHVQLITYCDAETGKPVPLWACTECKARFVPIAELLAAEAEVAKLHEALREAVIVGPQGKPGTRWTITCWQCDHAWVEGDPEHHAPDCLAAPKEGER